MVAIRMIPAAQALLEVLSVCRQCCGPNRNSEEKGATVSTYNPPSMKIPVNPSFCETGRVKPQTMKIGRARIMMSKATLKLEQAV